MGRKRKCREILLSGRIHAGKEAASFHSACLLRFALDIVVKKLTCSCTSKFCYILYNEIMLK